MIPEQPHGCPCARCAVSARRGNALLILIAALLAVLVLRAEPDAGVGPAAFARPPSPSATGPGGIVNPADDRVRMIALLEKLNATSDAILQRLNKPLSAEITRMPAAPAPAAPR